MSSKKVLDSKNERHHIKVWQQQGGRGDGMVIGKATFSGKKGIYTSLWQGGIGDVLRNLLGFSRYRDGNNR